MKKQTFNLVFLLLVIFYLVYAGIYIFRSSFIIDNERYFVLFDDAMISMRYAKNLAEGNGLVWNPGEAPVEGFTNPLWLAFMAIFHLFPIPLSKISLLIQASGAIFLICNLYFTSQIALSLTTNKIVPILSILLTAFYTPLNNWGLQGMEVGILTLIISSAVLLVLYNLSENKSSIWPFVILGFGTLVRIDIVVPYLVILVFLVFSDRLNRRRYLLWGIGLLILFIGGQTIFRYLYFGNLLPNTYYLKMSGFPLFTRIKRGGYVLIQLTRQMNWVLVLIPFTILLYRRDRSIVLIFLVILGQVAYSVYVGGDAWEHKGGTNRYLALVVPLFFILFVYASTQLLEKAIPKKQELSDRARSILLNSILIIFCVVSMINFNYLINVRSLERWALLRQPDFIEANKEYVRISNALKKFTTPDARIAVVTAGAIPYFTERPAIDLLGKNDPIIARQDNHIPKNLTDIRPGHMKWDYDYAIGQIKPDVIVQLWGDTKAAQEYIKQYYTGVEIDGMLFSSLTGSSKIFWEDVKLQE
jgi:hypothetical protein